MLGVDPMEPTEKPLTAGLLRRVLLLRLRPPAILVSALVPTTIPVLVLVRGLLGGLEMEPSHTQKLKSGYAKDAGSKTPRSSRFHFHPPGTAFYQAPFAATKAISKNPT
jgi:hypothetical protein